MLFNYQYLGPDIVVGFDSYKYSCKDTSPLSNYVMHPFWNQVVKLCPRWVAPNLLTFIGFLCCIAHNALTAIFDPHYQASVLGSGATPIPSWVWVLVSIFLFLAHTLDGIDGKQARRTGTSTPLGELFDHGCDSWSTLFITATFYSVFGSNGDGYSVSPFRMYFILWSVFFVFHIAHWEKYNTGIMYLPWSYDLAMLFGTVLYMSTAFGGFEMWKVKLPGDYSAGPVFEIILYVCCYIISFFMTVKNIVSSYQNQTGKMKPLHECVRPMVSYTVAFVLCMSWVIWSKNNVLENQLRLFFYMSGTLYANMSCRLIIAQMSSTRCELLNYLLLPLALAMGVSVSGQLSLSQESWLLFALSGLITLAHLHYVICVVRQMCDHLKVDCFRIPTSGGGPTAEHRLLPTSDLDDDEIESDD